MHLREQNNALVSVTLRADSLGLNANLISGVHPRSCLVDDRSTFCLSIDLKTKLYLQRRTVGAIGEPTLEPARVAQCLE